MAIGTLRLGQMVLNTEVDLVGQFHAVRTPPQSTPLTAHPRKQFTVRHAPVGELKQNILPHTLGPRRAGTDRPPPPPPPPPPAPPPPRKQSAASPAPGGE